MGDVLWLTREAFEARQCPIFRSPDGGWIEMRQWRCQLWEDHLGDHRFLVP